MPNDFLALLAQGLLVIAIPILIAVLFQWLRQRGAELRSRMTAQQQQFIEAAIGLAVRAAEQAGLTGDAKGGAAKKAYAIKVAQDYLTRLGVPVNVNMLTSLIEAEVYKQFATPTPPVDSPAARSELLERAVKTAVQAAEQSALSATIENLGPAKKRYAVELAAKYLGEQGVRVDPGLIGGLVEAAVLRQHERQG